MDLISKLLCKVYIPQLPVYYQRAEKRRAQLCKTCVMLGTKSALLCVTDTVQGPRVSTGCAGCRTGGCTAVAVLFLQEHLPGKLGCAALQRKCLCWGSLLLSQCCVCCVCCAFCSLPACLAPSHLTAHKCSESPLQKQLSAAPHSQRFAFPTPPHS